MIVKPRPLAERLLDSCGRRFSNPRSHFSRIHTQRGFIINPFAIRTGGDPFWGNTSALLHFDGTNGQTTTVDSRSGRTIVRSGTATLSTAWSAFGTASALQASGTGGWDLTASGSENYSFGDYTIEARIRLNTASRLSVIAMNVQNVGGNGFYFYVSATNKLSMILRSGTTIFVNHSGGTSLTTGVDYYVAAKGVSHAHSLWLQGAQEVSTTDAVTAIGSSSNATVSIGYDINVAGRELYGHIDEMRFTSGVGRNVSVVPVAAFPDF